MNVGTDLAADRQPRPKILVVDDDPSIRETTMALLTTLGFDVTSAASGKDALERVGTPSAIACVMLDLTMPKFDGRATLAALRACAPQLPVIVMSGYGSDGIAMDDYTAFLQKPFGVDALQSALGRWLAPVTT